VVEQFTHNPNIEGLNLATNTMREKKAKSFVEQAGCAIVAKMAKKFC